MAMQQKMTAVLRKTEPGPREKAGAIERRRLLRKVVAFALPGVALVAAGLIADPGRTPGQLLLLSGICILSLSMMFYLFSYSRSLRSEVVDALAISNAITAGKLVSRGYPGHGGTYIPSCRKMPVNAHFSSLRVDDNGSFNSDTGPYTQIGDTCIMPPGYGLLRYAKETGAQFLPDNLEIVIKDTMVNSLELASKVSVKMANDRVYVTLSDLANAGMCRSIRGDYPQLCTSIGCPVCSFVSCMVAECLLRSVIVESVVVDGSSIGLTYKLV